MKKITYVSIFPILIIASLFAGCAKKQQKSDKKVILTTILPVYCFTQEIAGNLPGYRVELLNDGGSANPHFFNLKPGDMKRIGDADIIVRQGLSIDAYINESTLKAAGFKDSSRFITLVDGIPPRVLIENFKNESFKGKKISDFTSAWDTLNPHLWVSPSKAAIMTRYLTKRLSELIPDDRDSIIVRGDRYYRQLDTLAQRYATAMLTVPNKKIVTDHNFIWWLARDTGMDIIGSIEPGEGIQPGPKRTNKLQQLMLQVKPAGILVDPNNISELAGAVSEYTGITIYKFDPVGIGKWEKGKYINTMKKNLDVLLSAMSD